MKDFAQRLVLAGCGHMAGAMLRRWLACGLDPARVTVVRPSAAAVAPGVRVVAHGAGIAAPDVLLLGFKPQQLADAAAAHAGLAGAHTLLISILAGVDEAQLRHHFPAAGAIVRVMPNLAVGIGQGVLLLRGDAGVHQPVLDALMAPLGLAHRVAPDQDFDVMTALTGCSPAFLYAFTQALADAAAAQGIDADAALRLAQASMAGAAAMAAARPADRPETLIAEVASAGGMTRAGLDVLGRADALTDLLSATLKAAAARAVALRNASSG